MINAIITQKDAVDELYERGKVCITAHKEADIDKKYRPYLALFADGTFLIDKRAKDDIVLQNSVLEFYKNYPLQKKLSKQYVLPQLLKAVYHRAQNFDWYLPQYNIPTNLSAADRQKLQHFLKRMLQRQCLSITTLTTPEWFRFYSPDKEKFALFSGGRLAVSQNNLQKDELLRNISTLYPQIEMIEIVPEYYINAIYEKLLYIEPSAREIYIGLVQKKLMERLKIDCNEALKVMQNQTYGWRKLLFLSEQNARSMIYSDYVENCFMRSDAAFAAQMFAKKDFHIGVFM